MYDCVTVYVSWAFSLFFKISLFVLFYSGSFAFHLCSKEGVELDGGGKDLGGDEGGETVISVYCMKKLTFNVRNGHNEQEKN